MAANVAIFVSKRLQRMVVAVLCLMTLQAALAYGPRLADPDPGVIRVHIGH